MSKVLESPGIGDESDDTLFKSLRGFLIFGRIIGLLPYKGIFSHSSANLKFNRLGIPSIITYLILFVLTFNAFLEFLQSTTAPRKNAYQIAQSVRSTLYYLWGTFIYINFLLRSKQFLDIFHTWRSTSIVFSKPDKKLKRDVILISVVILVSATLENGTLYVDISKRIFEAATNKSNETVRAVLKSYFTDWHKSWAKYFNYHPFILILVFVQHKFILFSWNWIDICITVLGRALYFKFKALCEEAKKRLVVPFTEKARPADKSWVTPLSDPQNWKQVASDYAALYELLQAFEKFLSPLIFISYMINIYYLCMQLLDGLTLDIQTHATVAEAVNRPWSFAHLLLRIYLLSICCAKVNVYAHRISGLINECPSECYNTEISRLDKRVNGGRDIGLTGLGGCFTVTKPFILTVLGVVFTIEIVLLQVVPNDSNGRQEKNCCCPS